MLTEHSNPFDKSVEPFLPYGRQTVSEADIAAVRGVLASEFLTQGPTIPRFEEEVARFVGAHYAVAANSATSALHMACMALGLRDGDRLWTSPTSFVASANCGRYCGAIVDFVDIDPKDGLMSAERLSEKLERAAIEKTLPKIIIPVHLCGSSCDMERISALAKIYGIKVIEDASHAIGGAYRESRVGSCIYSDITIFSFHPVKIITSGEGGMAVTNDSEVAERLRDLRSHGITKDPDRYMFCSKPWQYEQHTLGFNYRMTDIQAALGLSQLGRLEERVEARNKLFREYELQTRGLPIRLLKANEMVLSSYHLAVARLHNGSESLHERVFRGLRGKGIGVQVHYSPIHLQPYYRELGFKEGDFPEAEAYEKNAISLPLFPGMNEEDIIRVCSALKSVL